MPVDTRNKRSSAINPMSPWRGLWPNPDGTVAQADRQATDFLYSGILAAAPAGGGATGTLVRNALAGGVLVNGKLAY